MNNNRSRKYARTIKKCSCNSPSNINDEEEVCSFTGTTALGILGGTFLVGMLSGKLLCMLMKD